MIAFVCRTPIQLMRAIQMHLRMDLFSNDAAIFLANACAKKNIYRNIQELGIFDHVYIEPSSKSRGNSVRYLYGNDEYSRVLRKYDYEKLISFNIEGLTAQIIYNLNKKNKGFEYHCVEDGPSLYPFYEPHKYTWKNYQKWFGIDKEWEHIRTWWCSRPLLVDLPKNIDAEKKKLPTIDFNDVDLLNILNKVFDYEEEKCLDIVDVLIMEESFYTDGCMIDNYDYHLYEEIRKRYFDKKFVVKLHPRTIENRFKQNFEILSNISIPWELYIFNRGNSIGNIPLQMSIICSTMMSDLFMFGVEGKKLILGPLFLEKVSSQYGSPRLSQKDIDGLKIIQHEYNSKETFRIVKSKEELYEVLNEVFYKSK